MPTHDKLPTKRKKSEKMQHLLLDLYGCSVQKLADADGLRRFLDDLPDQLGMPKAGPADLYFIDAVSDPRDAGHSGLVLASLHVSLHAWPPYGMINIDVFSRSKFDEAQAIAFARTAFDPGDIEVHMVQRAIRAPGHQTSREEPTVSGGERPPTFPPHRCLWPSGCLNSTGSALMKYCPVHQDLLFPP